MSTCFAHAEVPGTLVCERCERLLCSICAFSLGAEPRSSPHSICPVCLFAVSRRKAVEECLQPIAVLLVAGAVFVCTRVFSLKQAILPTQATSLTVVLLGLLAAPLPLCWSVWLGRRSGLGHRDGWLPFIVAVAVLGPLSIGFFAAASRAITLFQALAHVSPADAAGLRAFGIPWALAPFWNSFAVYGFAYAVSVVALSILMARRPARSPTPLGGGEGTR
jgi:hypothetical protein